MPRIFSAKLERWPDGGLDILRLSGGDRGVELDAVCNGVGVFFSIFFAGVPSATWSAIAAEEGGVFAQNGRGCLRYVCCSGGEWQPSQLDN